MYSIDDRFVDPSIGQKAGFGGVILHGLSSYGITARGLVNTVGGGVPDSLKALSARFTSPVKLGGKPFGPLCIE